MQRTIFRSCRTRLLAGFLGSVLLFLPSTAPALGILVPREAGASPIQLGRTEVRTEILQNLARTRVVQEFHNPNPRQLEADFLFPVPKGADVTDFVLYMNGKPVKGEVLEKEKARDIYEGIVRRMQDPGLLEWIDHNLFKVRVFPVPANGTQKIELEFAQPLTADQGTFKYMFPLRTPKSARLKGERRPGEEAMTFDVRIRSDEPVRNVYSPSHPITTDMKDPKAVSVEVRSPGAGSGDFVLFYEPSQKDVALSLVATRPDPSGDGFFSLMLSPPIKPASGEIVPQDVTFVVDTSGSMLEGNKIEQARRALTYCVSQLRPVDRFALVRFSTETDKFRDTLMAATPENVESAKRWIGELQARGGTNIAEALETGLALRGTGAETGPTTASGTRLYTMVFLTDGLPTVGRTSPEEILKAARTAMEEGGAGTAAGSTSAAAGALPRSDSSVRIFTFGVGNDVNTKLLDQLADETRAASEYIRPDEDMEVPISRFFDKISQPAMTGLRLEIPGAEVYDLYPKELPDLFYGSQLTVFGRYRKPGQSAVRLTGTVAGKPAEFTYEKTFPERETENSFVEKLWGTRKIAWLLDSIRKSGESAEVKDEVIQLAKKYGVVTPYTSYLVTEDTPMPAPAAPPVARAPGRPVRYGIPASSGRQGAPAGGMAVPAQDWAGEASAARQASGRTGRAPVPAAAAAAPAGFSSLKAESGEAAVSAARDLRRLKEARISTDASGTGETRHVAGQTFRLENGVWSDIRISASDSPRLRVRYLSTAYFDVLRIAPGLREMFALGERIRIQLAGGILEVGPEGKEALDEADRQFLAGSSGF